MTDLLVWELVIPGGDDAVLERVTLTDEGAVGRLVTDASGPAAEVGWWQGALEPGRLGAARALAQQAWPFDETLTSPPAAGAWHVTGPEGRLGLWASATRQPGDALRGQLAAVRAACAEAADEPACVARFGGEWTGSGEARSLLLRIEAIGPERASLRLDSHGDEPAAFMTDEAEVLGFTGSEMWLPSGAQVYGVVDGWSDDGTLVVTGDLADPEGERHRVRAFVTVE